MSPACKLFWLVLSLCIFSGLTNADQEAVTRLRKAIFTNYSTTQRPVRDPSRVVKVHTKMWVFHVEDVNDTRQIIKFHGVMQMFWQDEFLTWNQSEYNGTTYIMAQNLAVWTPKVFLLNSASPNTFNFFWNLPVKIWNTGSVYATVELSVTSTCAFDFTNYPNDIQRCPVAFYMGTTLDQVTYSTIFDPELRFYWRQGATDTGGNKLTASNWEVADEPTVNRKYYTAAGLNDTLGDTPKYAATMIMEIWITFRRRMPYFRAALVLPAALTSVLTVASLMPMQTTSALGLLLLNLLIQGMYIDDLFTVVPKSIGIVPRIVLYYSINMILTVLAVFLRLTIQWSVNSEQKIHQRKQDETNHQVHDDNMLEKVQVKSCLHIFFLYATPKRLNLIFLTAYFLTYVICAALLL